MKEKCQIHLLLFTKGVVEQIRSTEAKKNGK